MSQKTSNLVTLLGTALHDGLFRTIDGRCFVLIGCKISGKYAVIGLVDQLNWVTVLKIRNLAHYTFLNSQVCD